MQNKEVKSKGLSFKLKLGLVVGLLVVAVSTFLAANGINEIQVKSSEGENISVEFKDADIQDVFEILALKGNLNIVADPDVTGLISVTMNDVPWEKVLSVVCRTYGYAYEREDNIIRVTTLEKQSQESLDTEVFTLNYAKALDVSATIDVMKSERGSIKYDQRANLVIVNDIPTNIYRIGKVIKRLDTITPQVSIEAKIIETSLTDDDRLGMKWNVSAVATGSSRPTTFPWGIDKGYGTKTSQYLPLPKKPGEFHSGTNPSFPLAAADDYSFGILNSSAFSLLLEAIVSRGKTNILSNPRITTLDNHPAKIHIGTDWPIAKYSFSEESDRFVITGWEYKSYGVLLEVTPTINKDGFVTLKLHPEISDKQDIVTFEGAEVPILSSQSAEATVMIKSGDTLVIGGLLKNKKVTSKTKVPILGDIPILGLFFTHKMNAVEKKDLLIFITPRIVNADNNSEQAGDILASQLVETTDSVKFNEKLKSNNETLSNSGSDELFERPEQEIYSVPFSEQADVQIEDEIVSDIQEDIEITQDLQENKGFIFKNN
ncbi:MAG: hypothetical protein DRP78_00655 [Candidatus Omnitrophota bacterium]|nr:MAG: hypothetical protein DRP78_00655 [Candidatus Omnitrophota bacterium]